MDEYYDLGRHGRTVTTRVAEAQRWFDRGLVWCYGYHHEEALRCFRRAADADDGCAMAHWGIANALGANYNRSWDVFPGEELHATIAEARRATEAALARLAGATDVERALVEAQAARYPAASTSGVPELDGWNDDYAAAMRSVFEAHRDDLDVAALFAEALINRTPWKLWDLITGRPAEGADTLEAVAALERAMQAPGGMEHPGVLHLYVHTMEMSPWPERALRAADALRDLVPDAGHLLHMPSHIDIQCGHYHAALVANERAIRADRLALERDGPLNIYTAYRSHDYHFAIYAAMFLGQYAAALAAAEELSATIPDEVLRMTAPPMAPWLEGFIPMKVHVLVRFGKWRELLAEPLPDDPELYCVTTALLHYGKAIAHATLGDAAAADAEVERFDAAFDRVPEERWLHVNRWRDILPVASAMMRGEVAYGRGAYDEAFEHLRRAAALDDALPYDEPWGWMHPPRHALGALLLEQGRVEEAAEAYRVDLGLDPSSPRTARHPDNVWSLHGYVECLERLGRRDEALALAYRRDLAVARADVPITSSCFCRTAAPSCCH
jgi:tetratricopeptide (TPR) repeat protein